MFGSVVLDVAIGMAFVYLLLSLVASVVQELLSAFMQLRAANLERGLRSLFSGDSLWGRDLADSLYSHGLIRGLYSDPVKDATGGKSAITRYVDRLRFFLRRTIGISSPQGVHDPESAPPDPLLLPAYIPSRTFALAMVGILNREQRSGSEAMTAIQRSLSEHHLAYRANKAGQALLTLALEANGDLKTFERRLEDWYNDAMDRVSAWYKRYTQRILLLLGVLLAVLLNVNSARVAEALWTDRDVRQAMVNAAQQYEQQHDRLEPPVAGKQGSPDLQKKLQNQVQSFTSVSETALLPVGWQGTWRDRWGYARQHKELTANKLFWRIPGWLLTGMAISLGASFWFDTLNKFMVVRSTIKPQEKSQMEGSKD